MELIRRPGNELTTEKIRGYQDEQDYLRHNYLKRVERRRRAEDRNAESTWREKFARVWST